MRFFVPFAPLLKGWLASFLGWGMVAAALAASGIAEGDHWSVHIRPSLQHWLPWAVVTPLLFRLVWRAPLDRQGWRRTLMLHAASCAIVLAGVYAWRALMPGPARPPKPGPASFTERPPRGPDPPPSGEREATARRGPPGGGPPRGRRRQSRSSFDLFRLLTFDLPVYLMLVSAAHAALFYRRDQERAASLARARLDALRMQLQPHFLFNTLNTIAELVHEEPEKADAMLTALSDLLRLTLETSEQRELSLRRELDFVEHYLAIMHARFEDRLRFEVQISPEAQEAHLPTFLLQPLVENAVEHGLQPKLEGGVIRLRAWRDGDRLRVAISDTGVGTAGIPKSEGVGLSNTRARLREFYGDQAGLDFRNEEGLTVVVTIPFHTAPIP